MLFCEASKLGAALLPDLARGKTRFKSLFSLGSIKRGAHVLVVGSGRLVTRDMDFTGFMAIEVWNSFEVRITRSESYNVSITADDNVFDYVEASRGQETLAIGLKRGYSYHSVTLRAKIMMPDLHGVRFSGATRGSAEEFSSSHKLVVGLSGASSLKTADMSVGDFEATGSGASRVTGELKAGGDVRFALSGSSKAELEGTGKHLLIRASGASIVNLSDFPVHNAEVKLSGASHATVNLDGRLDTNLSGASRLSYIGEPTMEDIHTSGGSRIRRA